MKRYLVFAGEDYYANGGALDFQSSFDSMDDAAAHGKRIIGKRISEYETAEWWHVFDAETGRIVCGVSGGYCGTLPEAEPK